MEDKTQDDLDLLYVFRSIKNAGLKILSSIKSFIDYSIRKKNTLLIFIILFASLCFGLSFIIPPYYRSEMSISHIRFEDDFCLEVVKNLNKFIDGNNNSALAEALHISAKDAKTVKTIRHYPLNKNIAKIYLDSAKAYLPFKIEVEIYDNSVLDTLQTSILNYLEMNDYATRAKKLDEELLEINEQQLKREVISLDSLKYTVNQSLRSKNGSSGITFLESMDPAGIYKHSMIIYDKVNNLTARKQFNETFTIRVGFTKDPKKASPGRLAFTLFGMLTGYIIGLIYVVRRDAKRSVILPQEA